MWVGVVSVCHVYGHMCQCALYVCGVPLRAMHVWGKWYVWECLCICFSVCMMCYMWPFHDHVHLWGVSIYVE